MLKLGFFISLILLILKLFGLIQWTFWQTMIPLGISILLLLVVFLLAGIQVSRYR